MNFIRCLLVCNQTLLLLIKRLVYKKLLSYYHINPYSGADPGFSKGGEGASTSAEGASFLGGSGGISSILRQMSYSFITKFC